MIPVVTTDKNGNLHTQVFNDNLTTVEQVNRIVLGTIAKAQTKLTNALAEFQTKVGNAEYTDEQLEALKATMLDISAKLDECVKDCEAWIKDPDQATAESV